MVLCVLILLSAYIVLNLSQSHVCNATTLSKTKPPGDNFDLVLDTLTTPEDKTISGSELNNGYSSNWFYTDSSDGSMSFYTPTNGSTTSGAEYARSELHHHCDGNDKSKNWYVQSGSHKMYVEMRFDEKSTFNKAIIGQIFGANYDHPLLKMYYYNNGLYAEYRNNANGDQTKVNYNKQVNNDKFNFELECADGIIKAFVNNEQLLSWNVTSYWSTSGNYFKSGNYIQSNQGKEFTLIHTYCIEIYNSGVCQSSPP